MKLKLFFAILAGSILLIECHSPRENLKPKQSDDTRKWGFVNDKGKEMIPMKYDSVGIFSEGLARVKERSSWGYIDNEGNQVILLSYWNAEDFSEGFACVNGGVGYGYIDKSGKTVIPLVFYRAGSFFGGKAKVELMSKHPRYSHREYYIDKSLTEEYVHPEKKFIWENLLEPNIGKIDDYQSNLNKSSLSNSSFTINPPYLAIDYIGPGLDNVYFMLYSDEEFNEHTVDSLKTLIIRYNYPDFTETYSSYDQFTKVTSMGSHLIYFDMDTKKCIGYDNIRGNKLKSAITKDDPYREFIQSDQILEQIETHLPNISKK